MERIAQQRLIKFKVITDELSADEILKKYNISLEKEPTLDADSILAKYGVSVEEPSPFKAEFAAAEIATTAVAPEVPMELGVVPSRIEELPEREIVESKAKDIADAFLLQGSRMWHQTKQYFRSTLPQTQLIDAKPALQKASELVPQIQFDPARVSPLERRGIEWENKIRREWRGWFEKKYNEANKRYAKSLAAKPQWRPRKEYAGGVIENVKKNPKILLDWGYWGYVAAQSAAFSLGIMGTTVAVTKATGNPILGLMAGTMVATPMQSQDLQDELMANGMSQGDAAQLAAPIGLLIAGVETLGDLPLLAAISKPFARMLHINITKSVADQFTRKALPTIAKRGVKTFLAIQGGEIAEELTQLGIQDGTVKTAAQGKGILQTAVETFEKFPETVAQTFMATTPFAMFGAGVQMRAPAMRAEIVPTKPTPPTPTVEKVIKPPPVVVEPTTYAEEIAKIEREFPYMTEEARIDAERRARLAAEEPLPPVEKVKIIPKKKVEKVEPKEPVMGKIEELYTKAMEATKEKGERLRLQKELSFIGGKITTPTEMRRLRRLTHAWQFRKGMTKKAFGEIVHKITGHWKTTHRDVTAEQLKKIISIVKEHRPKRIGYRTVVTEKTEGQISTLKENLIKTKSLTEDIFNKILERENIKYPGWVHKANFITEETGKKLIKRMVDEAPIYKNEIGTDAAMGKNPQVKKVYNTGRNFIEKKAERVQASPRGAIINTMKDWRYVAMDMQEQTNDPFYETYYRLNYKRRGLEVDNDKINDRWVQAGGKDFNNIAVDEERKMKINNWLASFLKEPGAPKRPTDMTTSELAMAKEIQKILKEFQPKVRYLRFFEWRNFGTKIPDATDKQLNEALDILNTEGYGALEKHLEKQSWGVIKSGYDIREVYRPKIRIKKVRPAPGRGHLRIREGMEYLKSDRDILQRVQSYVKQINTRYYLMEEINSLRSLFENNYDKFKDPRRIADAFDRLFRETLHQRNVSSALMNWVTKPYAQAMRAIFLDPYKYARNLIQNISLYASPQDFFNILKKSPLSEKDVDYYFRQGSQMTGLKHDYFMQYVGLPGFGKINKVVDKVNIYPKTDDINRVMCYIFKLGRIRKAMKKYPDNFAKMVVSAGFGDLQLLQRMEGMERYVVDKEDMARYLAIEETKNVHFVYERAMRAPAEQGGDFERVMSNLLTFRKGYIQRLWNNVNILRPSRRGVEAPYGARRRAFRVLTQMILVTTLAGWVFKRLVGRKRNPYSPLAIADDISLGGIPLGAQEQIGQLTHDVADALQGDRGALGRVIVAIPRAGDMYIPFYRTLVDITESVFGYKNLDYAALRQIRSALDKRYKAKGMNYYKVERNAVQMFRHALFGSREVARENESTLKQALRRRLK